MERGRNSSDAPPRISPRKSLIIRIVSFTLIYVLLSYYGGEIGYRLLYPIRIFVTFLHEFGHAAGGLLTGGDVMAVQIDPRGGGRTTIAGGNFAVILMGGYLGSAIFGNLLFYIAARRERWVKPLMGLLVIAMTVTAFVWHNSFFTTALLCLFAAVLAWIGFKTKFGRDVLMVLGLASIIYILQDTAVGPSSDLRKFETEMRFLPARVWMVIWLVMALAMLAVNLKLLLGLKSDGHAK